MTERSEGIMGIGGSAEGGAHALTAARRSLS